MVANHSNAWIKGIQGPPSALFFFSPLLIVLITLRNHNDYTHTRTHKIYEIDIIPSWQKPFDFCHCLRCCFIIIIFVVILFTFCVFGVYISKDTTLGIFFFLYSSIVFALYTINNSIRYSITMIFFLTGH